MAQDFDFVETDSAEIYATMIGSLMDACNEPLYPGDERRLFGEALVQVFVSLFILFDDKAKQRALRYARGKVLDVIGERYNVYRADPASASATFRFTASAAQVENIIIPAGTRITSDGKVYFATEETVVLSAGSTSVDVQAMCTVGGAAYNGYAAGSIGTLVDLIPYISGAANITVSAGGDDGEPYTEDGDEKFRERIRLAPAAFSPGTENGYRYYAMSADPDIASVEIDCPEDEPNTVNIYALMSGGGLPDAETLQKILDAINTGNVRIMTDHVQAFAPEVVEYTVEVKYYCTAEDEAATILSIEGEGGAIDQYNEWQSQALGRGINPDKLRSYLYNAGASMVDIVSPSRVTLAKNQVAKLSGPVVVSHEVVSG